jgi:hypothetical protein
MRWLQGAMEATRSIHVSVSLAARNRADANDHSGRVGRNPTKIVMPPAIPTFGATMRVMNSYSERFKKFEIDYNNAQIYANGKRIKAADEPTQENLDVAKAAREVQAALCRAFRNWCRLVLKDPGPSPDALKRDIATHLQKLEEDCPPGGDPQPSAAAGRPPARREM